MFNCNGKHSSQENLRIGEATLAFLSNPLKDFTITGKPVIDSIPLTEVESIGEWMSNLPSSELLEFANMRVD